MKFIWPFFLFVVSGFAQLDKNLPYFYKSVVRLEIEALEESSILSITFTFKQQVTKQSTSSKFPEKMDILLFDETKGMKLINRSVVNLNIIKDDLGQYYATCVFVSDNLNWDLKASQRIKLHLTIVEPVIGMTLLSRYLNGVQLPISVETIGSVKTQNIVINPITIKIDPKTVSY
jgi:hypothetical protein